jgi:hypothetical protein
VRREDGDEPFGPGDGKSLLRSPDLLLKTARRQEALGGVTGARRSDKAKAVVQLHPERLARNSIFCR